MIKFIIGGKAQGKLNYVLSEERLSKEDVCYGENCDYNNIDKKILYNFHLLCKRLLKDNIKPEEYVKDLLDNKKDLIIISDEVGYGIVPMEKDERIWREEVGRASIIIAKKSKIVKRIVAGLATIIKNDTTLECKKVEKSSSLLKVALIRHGITEGNKQKRYIGTTDESLSLSGIYDLFQSVSKEKYPKCNKIYLSPMKRCIETANIIYPKIDSEIVNDLRETNFGDFENKNFDELKNDKNYKLWLDKGGQLTFPNGEDRKTFSLRCEKAFEEIINKSLGEESISLVVHGGTIMAILDKYSYPHRDFYHWQVKNGDGYIILIDKNKWINNKKVIVQGEI